MEERFTCYTREKFITKVYIPYPGRANDKSSGWVHAKQHATQSYAPIVSWLRFSSHRIKHRQKIRDPNNRSYFSSRRSVDDAAIEGALLCTTEYDVLSPEAFSKYHQPFQKKPAHNVYEGIALAEQALMPLAHQGNAPTR
jgi:hypothetical protein